jgi:hypothetical protein
MISNCAMAGFQLRMGIVYVASITLAGFPAIILAG